MKACKSGRAAYCWAMKLMGERLNLGGFRLELSSLSASICRKLACKSRFSTEVFS